MGKKGKSSKNNVAASKSNVIKPTPHATSTSSPYLTEEETISRRPPPQQGLSGSMSFNSKMKYPTSLAAAMLSFPWPPPEKSQLALARLKEDKSKAGNVSGNDPNGNASNKENEGAGKVASESMKAKQSTSRKFYRKKSCCCCNPGQKEERNVVINGDPHRKPGEPFLPVTVPPFTHVHTAWPGFDHAPVNNWKNKYLIAKPYPYHQRKWESMKATPNDINSNAVFSRPSELDILDRTWRNQTGRSLASGGKTSSTRMSRMNKFDGLTSDEDKPCVCSTACTTLHKRSIVRPGGGCCMRK